MDWINLDIAIPSKPMKVIWKYSDECEDVGWWNGKEFMTRDPTRLLPIIAWMPLGNAGLTIK